MIVIEDNKVNSTKKIEIKNNPKYIYIPLEDIYSEYECLYKVNDYVYKDEIIAKNKEGFPIHSPISGTIKEFTKKTNSQGKLINSIKIENDYKDKIKVKKVNNDNLSKDEFINLLKEGGITGLSGNGFPTYIKYNNDIKYLIVNGVECEPYISCDNSIMYQYAEEILEILDKIYEIMKLDKIYIAIKENNTKIINNFLKYINSYSNIKVYPVEDYYPAGWERNIIKDIFNISYDRYPAEASAVVSNISTIYAIYELITYNKPLTSRVITICGDGIKSPVNVRVKVGDVLSEVINNHGLYKKNTSNHLFITKGPMNGISHKNDDIIVTKDLTGVVVMDNKDEKVYPCIRCGKCIKVCPSKLKPVVIMNNINSKKLGKLHPDKCIGCGLCSYICPSHIEIREFVKIAKEKEL